MRRSTLFFLLSFLLASTALAQQFGETVEVRIANIDVVVMTKDGRHVGGLTRDDFELVVDGSPRPISHFAEYREGSPVPAAVSAGDAAGTVAPESVPRRKQLVVFFIDAYSLDMRRRAQAVESLRKFASQTLLDGDEAMVAIWNHRMIIPQTFTADKKAIDNALAAAGTGTGGSLASDRKVVEMMVRSTMQEAEVGGGRNIIAAARSAYGTAITHVNHHAEEQRKLAQNMVGALEELCRAIAGADGKKSIVVVGENFPHYPGLGLYQFVNETFARFAGSIQFVQPQMIASQLTLADLPIRLARAANENEITLHTIYSGDNEGASNAEQDRIGSDAMLSSYLDFSDTGGSFAAISRETGGTALIGSTNFDQAVNMITQDMHSYYSIGYRVDPSKNATEKVEVRPKNRNFVVRARRANVPKSLDQQIADRVTTRLFQTAAADNEEVVIKIGASKKSGRGKVRIPVELTFPSSLLTLLPQDGKQVGGFEIAVAASDGENRLSEVARKRESVSWSVVPPMVSYTLEVELRNRAGTVSVGVVDTLSKSTYFRRVAIAKS
jgi:VWFA-related protein